jgi:hypothetical protein
MRLYYEHIEYESLDSNSKLALKETLGCCEMCGTFWNLEIDHEHETNWVRGVLCGDCNKVLGRCERGYPVGETTLRRAADYLETSEEELLARPITGGTWSDYETDKKWKRRVRKEIDILLDFDTPGGRALSRASQRVSENSQIQEIIELAEEQLAEENEVRRRAYWSSRYGKPQTHNMILAGDLAGLDWLLYTAPKTIDNYEWKLWR